MNRLDLKPFKFNIAVLVLVWSVLVLVGFRFVLGGSLRGFLPVPFFIGLACLAVCAVVLFVVFYGRGQSLKYLSDDGAMRHDGQNFPWSELGYVLYGVRFTRLQKKDLLWVKIFFKNGGVVFMRPRSVSNFRDVLGYIEALPCQKKESTAIGIRERPTP